MKYCIKHKKRVARIVHRRWSNTQGVNLRWLCNMPTSFQSMHKKLFQTVAFFTVTILRGTQWSKKRRAVLYEYHYSFLISIRFICNMFNSISKKSLTDNNIMQSRIKISHISILWVSDILSRVIGKHKYALCKIFPYGVKNIPWS